MAKLERLNRLGREMLKDKYSAGMVKHPTWFNEFREYINLRNSGLTDIEIKELVKEQNIFLASSPVRASMMYGVLTRRSNAIGIDIRHLFPRLDVSNQQIVNIIAVMLEERVFRDFMIEVYANKLLTGQLDIGQKEYRAYWQNKQATVEATAKWTDQTIHRMSGTFRTYLFESQLIRRIDGVDEVVRPLIDFYLRDLLKIQHKENILYALTGGN